MSMFPSADMFQAGFNPFGAAFRDNLNLLAAEVSEFSMLKTEIARVIAWIEDFRPMGSTGRGGGTLVRAEITEVVGFTYTAQSVDEQYTVGPGAEPVDNRQQPTSKLIPATVGKTCWIDIADPKDLRLVLFEQHKFSECPPTTEEATFNDSFLTASQVST